MKYKAYNAKRDANEPLIVDCLRNHGLTVERLNQPLDLLVGYGGFTVLAEVKAERNKRGDPKPYSKDQVEFLEWWTGGHTLLVNLDDAKQLAKRMKNIARLQHEFSVKSLPIQGVNATKSMRPDGYSEAPAKPPKLTCNGGQNG